MIIAGVVHDSEYNKLSFVMFEFDILVFMLIRVKDELDFVLEMMRRF